MTTTHELATSEDPQLVDGLLEKTAECARKACLDGAKSAHVVNAPARVSRASALQGLMDTMPDLIGLDCASEVPETVALSEDERGGPPASSGRSSSVKEQGNHSKTPQPDAEEQASSSNGDLAGMKGISSIFAALKATPPPQKVTKTEGARQAKGKAKRGRKPDADDDAQPAEATAKRLRTSLATGLTSNCFLFPPTQNTHTNPVSGTRITLAPLCACYSG